MNPLLVASLFAVPLGIACGLGASVFLAGLEVVTTFRFSHPWVVFGLPLAGWVLGKLLEGPASSVIGGTGRVVERLQGGPALPSRMGPLVVAGTWLTHLFGGSAGREGTAVQMGASIADLFNRITRVTSDAAAHLTLCGVAAGFAGVFGAPWAGIVFALELGGGVRRRGEVWFPLVLAAWSAELAARSLGTTHPRYPLVRAPALDWAMAVRLAGLCLALAAVTGVFVASLHSFRRLLQKRLPLPGNRLLVGGLAVVAVWVASGRDDVLGLGVPTLLDSFTHAAGAETWALKALVTVFTVGAGFVGGEVTPLFFIGATFGSAIASMLGLPIELCAALGLVTVFGAASGAPLAMVVMGGELFGWEFVAPALPVVMATSLISRRFKLYGQ